MRADKRSFSFTWTRGQKTAPASTHNNDANDSGIENPHMQVDHDPSPSSWFMTNASITSSSSGVSSMSGSSSVSTTSVTAAENKMEANDSKSRLRRLGHSFTRFGTKYSIIEDEEENQPLNAPEPGTPTSSVVGVAVETPKTETTKNKPVDSASMPVHFDEDGNFIGRQGQQMSAKKKGPSAAARRKSRGSNSGRKEHASLGRRINKTMQEVKASVGSFSQIFRRSTRRRYRMGRNTPLAELTPTPTRKILGRTPTKLYSPFEIGFGTPAAGKTPKRLERPSTPRLTRRSVTSGLMYSPANNFGKDLAEARRGMEDFHILSRDITRRSVRF